MSDLIDRNAVMLRVREFIENPTYNENMLVNDINALPSAEPERKWIPVTERLPEEDIDVLLQFPKNMGVGYQEDGFWNIVTGNDMYSGLDEGEAKPIAWMPLPEPAIIGDV